MLDVGHEAITTRAAEQVCRASGARYIVQQLGARFQINQRGYRLTIAARAGQGRHRHRVNTTIRAKRDESVHRAALIRAIQTVACLEGKGAGFVAMAGTCTHPTFFGDHHGHRLVNDLDFGHSFFLFLNQRAAWVGKGFGVGFNFFDHQAAQRRWVAHDVFKLGLFVAQLFELLLNLDGFQTRQLTQANF